jgi:hypothetical protein
MKIIIDNNKVDSINKDARERIKAIEEQRIRPMIPSIHTAVNPKICNRCGGTFWEPDQSCNIFCRKPECDDKQKTDAIGIGF